MTQINAYLSFNGGCREAMNFYKECQGRELTLQTAEGTPMEAQCAGALKDQIMHGSDYACFPGKRWADYTGHRYDRTGRLYQGQ